VDYYEKKLDWSKISGMKLREGINWNYSYFPVTFKNEETLLNVQAALNAENIFPRRYFYPSLNTIGYVEGSNMPISESIAARILCLPLHAKIETEDLDIIAKIISTCV
jgi:dTDP-4-amino-4,6-dideoxygalactose transaminase